MIRPGNDLLLIAGLGITGLLVIPGLSKKLRSDRVLLVLAGITFVIAVAGIILRSAVHQSKGSNSADMLLSPFVYVALYALFRKLYKRKFGIEPTCNRNSWYDPDEKRRQNVFDVIVHIAPMVIAFMLPPIITAIAR